MTVPERRQFERLAIPENAVAYSEDGCKLGQVTAAGGGGMAIRLEVEGAKFTLGDRLQVTVLEPARNIRHTIQVTVVYLHEGSLGVEFL